MSEIRHFHWTVVTVTVQWRWRNQQSALFCLLNLKREGRKLSVKLENTPCVLSLLYFSKWSSGNHRTVNFTLSVKFTTLKNILWKFHLFCLHHTQLSLSEKNNGEPYVLQKNEKFSFYLDFFAGIEHGFWLHGRWYADFRNSLLRDKKTELEILLSYRFRMVLITGCPLLIVKKREITDFLLKKAQTVRSFCTTHRVKTQLPTKLLIRYFLSSIEENTVLFFSRRPGKSDPWKSSRQSIKLYRPHQKKLVVIWR